MARWEGIDEFLKVVETGSFTTAARLLGVSKSYVSKQVNLLEDRLQARLLQRTTRKLTLTDMRRQAFYDEVALIREFSERNVRDFEFGFGHGLADGMQGHGLNAVAGGERAGDG